MRTPTFQQLDGLCAYLKTSLRADTDLQAELDLANKGYLILEDVLPAKIFDVSEMGLHLYITQFPALGIYAESMTSTRVRGEVGFDIGLGIQYVIKGQVGDARDHGWPVEAKMGHIMMVMAWKIRDYLQQPSTQLDSYHIASVYADSFQLLPGAEGVYAMQGNGSMKISWPPWKTTGNAVALDEIRGAINETSAAGGTPEVIATHTDYVP